LSLAEFIKTLEKTEGSAKNGESRDRCNIGHKTQNKNKRNKQHNTKKEEHGPHQQTEVNSTAPEG